MPEIKPLKMPEIERCQNEVILACAVLTFLMRMIITLIINTVIKIPRFLGIWIIGFKDFKKALFLDIWILLNP